MSVADLNFSVLAPSGFVALGARCVLMGEVFLSRAGTILGRVVTEAWIGSMLAIVSMLFLGLAL